MKKTLTLLFLAATLSASAQFCRKDTSTQYSINNTTFVKTPTSRIINYFKSSTDNQLDSQLVQQWGEGSNGQNQWLNLNKTAYTYANGQKTIELYSLIPQGQTAWQKSRKQNWSYNAAGKGTLWADSSFIPANNNYIMNRTELNLYDANSNNTQKTIFSSSIPVRRENRTFNAANLVTLFAISSSADNGVTFVANSENIFTYDAKNRVIEEEVKIFNTTTQILEPINKYLTNYDANDNKTLAEVQRYQAGNWVGQSKTEWTYNADKQVTEEANPLWNGTQWVNAALALNTYTNKLLTRQDGQRWGIQAPGNTWTTTNTYIYTYNQYSKLLSETSSVWQGPMNGMVVNSRVSYTYVDSSEWTEKINANWNQQTLMFVNTGKSERSFNAKGSITREAIYTWIAMQNSWRPSSSSDYTYSATNKLIRVAYGNWDNGRNQFLPGGINTWEFHPTYDYETANARQYNYNPSNAVFGTHNRTEYACVNSSTQTNSLKNINKASLKVYPNPNSSGVLNIENAANGVLSIYNTMGQKVITQNIDETNSSIDISKMTKGIYIVILESNGTKLNTKLIVE